MIDIGSIASVAGSLKTAGEIAKAMLDVRDAQAIQAKVIELNGIILTAQGSALAAQTSQAAMLKQISDLEHRLVELEHWAAEKERYALKDYGCQTFARELKAGMEYGEPPHRICARCYDDGKKSLLQHRHHNRGQEVMECKTCGNVALGSPGELPRHTNSDRPRRRPTYG